MVGPKKKEEVASGPPRTSIIDTITAPLGFFVLALLIVEAFLANVLIFARLTEERVWYGVLVGVGMFVLVVVIVALLVWFKPQNLTFDKTAHLMDRGKMPWGTDQKPMAPEKLFSDAETGTKP